jgi:hypothetical protein
MKRKDYQRPTMNVVKLQHHGMLMTSGTKAMRSGYGTAVEDTWSDDASSRRGGNDWDEE